MVLVKGTGRKEKKAILTGVLLDSTLPEIKHVGSPEKNLPNIEEVLSFQKPPPKSPPKSTRKSPPKSKLVREQEAREALKIKTLGIQEELRKNGDLQHGQKQTKQNGKRSRLHNVKLDILDEAGRVLRLLYCSKRAVQTELIPFLAMLVGEMAQSIDPTMRRLVEELRARIDHQEDIFNGNLLQRQVKAEVNEIESMTEAAESMRINIAYKHMPAR
ncbi:MAG: hypothetical protein M1821_005990 [Bathelium mastoideum]|nr:MAG: hypothetical protein M1821_005990 [Bathelium mastoideum]KAI9688473.1 MAG: hypothetical protein M1822_001422 [Bathelium mastoideum]